MPLTTQAGVVNGFGVPSRTFALYNPMGWKTFVSEASTGGSAFGSTFLYHRPNDPRGAIPDPFGRPAEIHAADGKKAQLAYEGARVVRRSQRVQQQVQTRSGAATVWSTAEVWATTEEQHDGLGRLREVKDPNGTRTTYTYDPGGRLVTATTRSGNKAQTRTFSYDGRGFLFRENPAESGAVTYRYDARGNAIAKGTPTGTIFFSYDAAGRLTKLSTPDGKLREHVYGKVGALTGKLLTSKAYNYRATGTCTEYLVQEDYRYDAAGGRLSDVGTTLFQSGSQQEKWTQSYGYDGAGRVTQIIYPSCLTGCSAASRSVNTTYTYGKPTSIPGFANAITYSENGTLSKIEHANGVVFTSVLDPKGIARPGSLRADRGATPVWPQESYTFDGAGNIKQIGAKSFTYDNLSRLTSATLPTASGQPYQEYAYDAFGNLTRLYRGTSKGNVTYVDYQTSTATNRLTGASYDGSGSMTAYQGTAYTWDVLQQLAKVDATAAGSEAWTHVYDAAGERVWSWRTSSTRVDTFALRGPDGKVLSLFTKTPPALTPTYTWEDYFYREGQLLGAKMPDGAARHFDLDHLGSVRLETDTTGTVAYRELWPYGEEATPPGGGERMKFTGHERDLGVATSTADDLDYMHARYYRPSLGRFLSVDPSGGSAGNPQGWNRYAYVQGNPLKLIDPDGRNPALVVGVVIVGATLFFMPDIANTPTAATDVQRSDRTNERFAVGAVGAVLGPVFSKAWSFVGSKLGVLASKFFGAEASSFASKAAAREGLAALALPEAQAAAANRTISRATTTSTISISQGESGAVVIGTARPGANGFQVIETTIAPDGTKVVVQRAYDAAGNLVHVDPKSPSTK